MSVDRATIVGGGCVGFAWVALWWSGDTELLLAFAGVFLTVASTSLLRIMAVESGLDQSIAKVMITLWNSEFGTAHVVKVFALWTWWARVDDATAGVLFDDGFAKVASWLLFTSASNINASNGTVDGTSAWLTHIVKLVPSLASEVQITVLGTVVTVVTRVNRASVLILSSRQLATESRASWTSNGVTLTLKLLAAFDLATVSLGQSVLLANGHQVLVGGTAWNTTGEGLTFTDAWTSDIATLVVLAALVGVDEGLDLKLGVAGYNWTLRSLVIHVDFAVLKASEVLASIVVGPEIANGVDDLGDRVDTRSWWATALVELATAVIGRENLGASGKAFHFINGWQVTTLLGVAATRKFWTEVVVHANLIELVANVA